MHNINFTVLENSKINILHRRIYGHMHLWPEMLLDKDAQY